GEYRGPAVALPFLRRAEIPMVSFYVPQLLLDLHFLGLGFLEAQDVRPFPVHPLHESFFIDGAETVHVPGNQPDLFQVSSELGAPAPAAVPRRRRWRRQAEADSCMDGNLHKIFAIL